MSSINTTSSRVSYLDTTNPNKYDNFDTYSTLSEAPIGNNAVIDRLIFTTDNSTTYKWNGTMYVVVINSASGTVLSVNSGNQTNITGTSQNPIVNVSVTPSFNTVTLNNAITTNTQATTKLYVDTADNTLQTNITNLDNATLKKASNLSDLTNTTTARSNLSVYSIADTNTLLDGKISDSTNVGTGTGLVYRDKTLTSLNLKTLKAGTAITINNNSDDITINSTATGVNSVTNTDTNLQIDITDPQNIIINASGITTNATNLTNHITNVTDAHDASAISTNQNLNYITTSDVQNNLSQLDGQVFANTGNITTLTNDKISSATNVGIGTGIFRDKTTTNLNFKSLIAGTAITIGNNTDDLTINSTGVTSITNQDAKIVIDSINPAIPKINLDQYYRWGNGASRGLIYQSQSPLINGAQISVNASLTASITLIDIGWLPVNRGFDSDMLSSIKSLWTFIKDNLPMKIRLIDVTAETSYVTMSLDSLSGIGSDNYVFACSNVADETTMVNIVANGGFMYLLFDYSNKDYINAQDLIVATNLTNHLTSTSAHTDANLTNTPGTRTYGIGSKIQNALDGLDTECVSLQTNKIDTLTSANNFLTITAPTANSRLLTTRSNAYLIDAISINLSVGGILTLNGASQTGHPFYSAGTTLTVKDDLILDGPFTMSSTANLIVYGNLTIFGSLTMNASCNITCYGNLTVIGTTTIGTSCSITTSANISFKGASSANTLTVDNCNFKCDSEFSVKNFSSTTYISFNSSCIFNARSIIYDGNSTAMAFLANGTHILTADEIIFSNNANAASGTGSGSTLAFRNTNFNAITLKILNNTSTNYVSEFQGPCNIISSFVSISDNTTTTDAGFGNFFNATNFICDDIYFKSNIHMGTVVTSQAIYFTATTSIISKNIFFINNSTGTGNTAFAVLGNGGTSLKADTIHIVASTTQQNIIWQNDIYGLYNTRRTPSFFIDNTGAGITGFNQDSYLGVTPMCWKQFENITVPYVGAIGTTAGVLFLNPSSFIFGPVLGVGYNQYQLISSQFSATANNTRLQYIGLDSAFIEISATISFDMTTNRNIAFQVYRNGSTLVPQSTALSSGNGTVGFNCVNIYAMTQVIPNDYFELSAYIVSGGLATTINFYGINWHLKKMSIM